MNQDYRQFTLWTCSSGFILGIVAMFAVLALGALLPGIMDVAISLALFIPDKFGLVEHVADKDTVFMANSGTYLVTLPREGTYYVFSPKSIVESTSIELTLEETGQAIEVTSALILNDRNLFPGYIDKDAPQFIFYAVPGQYRALVDSSQRDLNITIVPYVGEQNTTVAVVSGFIQIGLAAFVVRQLYWYLNRERLAKEKARSGKKRDEWTAFLDKEMGRRTEDEQ